MLILKSPAQLLFSFSEKILQITPCPNKIYTVIRRGALTSGYTSPVPNIYIYILLLSEFPQNLSLSLSLSHLLFSWSSWLSLRERNAPRWVPRCEKNLGFRVKPRRYRETTPWHVLKTRRTYPQNSRFSTPLEVMGNEPESHRPISSILFSTLHTPLNKSYPNSSVD